jgi:hypothetical protein
MKQYIALDDTVYFWFAGNDTSGSGGDGASPAADVRLAGAAADAAPVYSPTPSLLSHANYPAGAYEIAITASAANGFAATNTYAVFCTLAIDAQNPTGFVGSFDTKPVESNLVATGADAILKDSTFALAIADAMWDEILTGATHNIATSAGRRVREIAAFAIHGDTAQSGTTTSITLAAAASADDGIYNRNLIAITEGTGAGQTRQIADYNGTTKVASVDREWRISPDATSVYQVTADNVFALVDQGMAQAGTATTITLRSYAASVNDTYLCNQVAIIAGTGRGQARLIGSYNGTTKVATICGDNWVTIPDTTSVYVLLPYGTTCTSCVGTHALTQIRTEMEGAGSKILAIENDTNELQTNQSNWITATGFSVPNEYDAVLTAIQADLDNPAQYKATGFSVPNEYDAVLAAIKGATFDTATDSLEALRNRGDAAWITGGGGAAPTVEQIRTEMDNNSTKLAKIKSIANFIRTKLL